MTSQVPVKPFGSAAGGAFLGMQPLPADKPYPMLSLRGDSLAQPFDLRKALAANEIMIGCGLLIPNAQHVRLAALSGFDFAFLDWEHSVMTSEQVTEYTRWINFASEGRTAAIVRVPNHEHHYAAWVLDAGASGIVFPHTETVEQAQKAVASVRFPTQKGGARSFPPVGLFFGVNDGAPDGVDMPDIYHRAALILQIESVLGAENADAIAQVEGVDGFMVGVGDLSLDIKSRLSDPAAIGAELGRSLGLVFAAAKAHRKPILGFTPDPSKLKDQLEQGYRAVAVAFDSFGISKLYRDSIATSWALVKEFKDEQDARGAEPNGTSE
ncbi:hypothetical protein Q5752_000803 [Cryptotrichosporon argae]